MCGIAGYMVTDSRDPRVRLAITVLGLKQADRGHQSWGMFYGNPDKMPLVHRVAASIEDTFDLPVWLPLQMAVHTRHATTGRIKVGNTHPFTKTGDAGTVVGMHNGIIDNHAEVALMHNREYSVDSEHIFAQIADGLPLSELEGYGTIVYVHDSKWFIGRFNGGELAIAITELGVFYCSEKFVLEHSLRLAQIEIKKLQYAVDGTLYTITPEGIEKVDESLDVRRPFISTKWQDGKVTFGGNSKDIVVTDDTTELDPTQELGDDLPDGSIHFYSDGCVCDDCGELIPVGADMFFHQDTLYCDACYCSLDNKEVRA